MKKWVHFLFLCATLTGFAADPMGCPGLKGILILGNWDLLARESLDEVRGVEVRDVSFFAKNRTFLESIQAKYIGKPYSEQTLWELKREIAGYYESQNQLFTLVSVPKQSMTNGVFQIVVEETKLGEVRSRGNRYFTGTDLMSYIRTKPGETLIEKEIVEDLAWMNKNPFRRTDIVYVPGKKPNTADIELATIDRWPYRIYMGADNTGTIATERDRLFFGFNFGKTLIRDADISYQFTFSPNWNRFYSHTASTRIPCSWRHEFLFYGGYSQVEPALDVDNNGETGTSWQVDGRYRIPIMDSLEVMQTLVVGYDFKETSNRIKEDGHTIFNATADINQFMLGYEFGWKSKALKVTFVGEVYANPGGITEKNKTRDYEQFRFEAGSQYVYLKAAHSLAANGWGWRFSYDLTGQYASKNLLPSEQFTLTGYNAVRGFEERIALVDNAAILNVSVETPHWSFAKFCGAKKYFDELYFLGFFDAAAGCNHQRAPGEKKLKTLGSVGPGARYQFSRYVSARFDYGFQLWHRGFYNPTHSRYNFGLIVSY